MGSALRSVARDRLGHRVLALCFAVLLPRVASATGPACSVSEVLSLPHGAVRIEQLIVFANANRCHHPARAAVAYRAVANEADGRIAADARFEYARLLVVLRDYAGANREFNVYSALSTSPPFLQEAMRQRMRLCLRLARPDEAASVARQYLARFPAGPYTNLARRLVISPAARRGLEAY